MSRFLIDANLPYRFSIWKGENLTNIKGEKMPWEIAENNWTEEYRWFLVDEGREMKVLSVEC